MPFAYRCSPDSMYIMNCSFELLEQTADVSMAARLAGVNLDSYFDLYDAGYTPDGASPAIQNLCDHMHTWTDTQDELTRALILSQNIYGSRIQLNELVGTVSTRLIENYLSQKGFKKTFASIPLGNPDTEPCLRNEFGSGIFFDMTISRANQVTLFEETDIIFPANVANQIITEPCFYSYVTMLRQQLKKAFECKVSLQDIQQHWRSLVATNSSSRQNELSANIVLNSDLAPKTASQVQKAQLNARKAIKKGIKKFSNLFGQKDISSFVSGDGFVAEGKKFKWQFRQKSTNSLITMTHSPLQGHIPYQLSVMTKENVILADCCVYVADNTPIIDQVITIMLHIQDDEDELLEYTNLFNKRPEFEHYRMLFPERHQQKSNLIDLSTPIVDTAYDNEFQRLQQRYYNEIEKIVADIIGIDYAFFTYMKTPNLENILLANTDDLDYKKVFSNQKLLLR